MKWRWNKGQICQFLDFRIFTFIGLVIHGKLDIWLESSKSPSGSTPLRFPSPESETIKRFPHIAIFFNFNSILSYLYPNIQQYLKNISLYFVPGLLKRQNLKFCIYFLLSNIHNMFRHSALITWYLIYDWQKNHNRSQKKQTQLSLSTFTFQRKWEPSPMGGW